MDFQKKELKHTPEKVGISDLSKNENSNQNAQLANDTEVLVNKLMDHLAIIQKYKDRIAAFDYLIDNAKILAGNLKYITTNESLLFDIESLGGDGNYVDMILFERAVDIVVQNYDNMALAALIGSKQ